MSCGAVVQVVQQLAAGPPPPGPPPPGPAWLVAGGPELEPVPFVLRPYLVKIIIYDMSIIVAFIKKHRGVKSRDI